ncbi:MAG: hypothetical protein JWM26_2423 [Betaproteobacteria bacterium]|jgi:hypothetical protein|nr:hypothetical protein [Betaproteobacteria bacterium]
MTRSSKAAAVIALAALSAAATGFDALQQPSSATVVSGQKLDSGLGELPQYALWAQHPATRSVTAIVNHVPGEKLDSGL